MTGYQSKRAMAQDKLAQPAQEPLPEEPVGHMAGGVQPAQERNFCPRCGKRTPDLTTIHTCTPPQENI